LHIPKDWSIFISSHLVPVQPNSNFPYKAPDIPLYPADEQLVPPYY
jgi:hypothetical protein